MWTPSEQHNRRCVLIYPLWRKEQVSVQFFSVAVCRTFPEFRHFYCAVAPPGPVTVGQYRPHDLHCGTKDDSNGQFSNRAPRLAATEKKRPATCDLLSGVNYNGHASTSSHRLEVDRAQPRAESTFPDEVKT